MIVALFLSGPWAEAACLRCGSQFFCAEKEISPKSMVVCARKNLEIAFDEDAILMESRRQAVELTNAEGKINTYIRIYEDKANFLDSLAKAMLHISRGTYSTDYLVNDFITTKDPAFFPQIELEARANFKTKTAQPAVEFVEWEYGRQDKLTEVASIPKLERALEKRKREIASVREEFEQAKSQGKYSDLTETSVRILKLRAEIKYLEYRRHQLK